MNDFAVRWIEALRSGKYPQGFRWLIKNQRFCCLGVACALFWKELNLKFLKHDGATGFDGEFKKLPKKVQQALGLRTSIGDYKGKDPLKLYALSRDNDEGISLIEIAKTIESKPEGLFL